MNTLSYVWRLQLTCTKYIAINQHGTFAIVSFDGERISSKVLFDTLAKMQISIGMEMLMDIPPLWRFSNGFLREGVLFMNTFKETVFKLRFLEEYDTAWIK